MTAASFKNKDSRAPGKGQRLSHFTLIVCYWAVWPTGPTSGQNCTAGLQQTWLSGYQRPGAQHSTPGIGISPVVAKAAQVIAITSKKVLNTFFIAFLLIFNYCSPNPCRWKEEGP